MEAVLWKTRCLPPSSSRAASSQRSQAKKNVIGKLFQLDSSSVKEYSAVEKLLLTIRDTMRVNTKLLVKKHTTMFPVYQLFADVRKKVYIC